MKNELILNNTKIQYELQYKKVKNINLRIKTDGTIYVSANKRVSKKVIDSFLISKKDFIIKALAKQKNMSKKPKKQYYDETEIRDVILNVCKDVYPYYEERGIVFPQIKFRKMISRWGSCHSIKGILTFNINLMYAPFECIKYVVLHEFSHFLEPNHSSKFYDELIKVCPDWKIYKNMLKEIHLR